jgi:hypothetical protein
MGANPAPADGNHAVLRGLIRSSIPGSPVLASVAVSQDAARSIRTAPTSAGLAAVHRIRDLADVGRPPGPWGDLDPIPDSTCPEPRRDCAPGAPSNENTMRTCGTEPDRTALDRPERKRWLTWLNKNMVERFSADRNGRVGLESHRGGNVTVG